VTLFRVGDPGCMVPTALGDDGERCPAVATDLCCHGDGVLEVMKIMGLAAYSMHPSGFVCVMQSCAFLWTY
jgi:hypothetical protein